MQCREAFAKPFALPGTEVVLRWHDRQQMDVKPVIAGTANPSLVMTGETGARVEDRTKPIGSIGVVGKRLKFLRKETCPWMVYQW